MSKRIGKFTKIWVEQYHLSTLLSSVSPSTSFDEVETGGYTQNKMYLAARGDGTISVEGFFSDTANETHDALKSLSSGGTSSIITAAYGANALPIIGDSAVSFDSQQLDYTTTPDLNGAIMVSAEFKARGVVPEYGVLLADATITATGNQSSYDQTSQTTGGAVGYLHITSLSAGDTITVVIQDSPDDAAWADLVTFTLDGTAVGAERVAVAGTVDRYVRAEYSVTGSGVSFPIVVNFARL